ncbi:carbohydrate binding domain-containing protein [Fibrobacter sp. UBA4309]|uniref:carbohydrate binding domain-containing protein n=1 Tax=Fibrobacter sp. UBA4309 TaxID=1946537 RepID=UPI0025BDCF23|nr:carbohydrate binding domain-containing protein [Fibrobacter sp. UBA4309]
MRFLKSIIGCCLCAIVLVGCSDSKDAAGIEIGNPALANEDTIVKPPVALALTADFSVDYDDVKVLAKGAAKDEPVLLDSFSMTLTQVRSYSSYYVSINFDAAQGLPLWPEENATDSVLGISFTEGSAVDDAFSNINLKDEGYLKEIGVCFRPEKSNAAIRGKILIKDDYVPFEYSLSAIQNMTLRYHFSQVEWVTDSLVNLSVVFHVRYFVDGVDLASATVSDDGVIYFNASENVGLWNKLNQKFISSFRPLRYEYTDAQGNQAEDYVKDIWEGIVGEMSDNTIENGNFSKGMDHWVFFTQLNGEATSKIVEEKNGGHILEVDVTNGGNKSYSVQLIQEDVALVAGKKYKCVFTIWSNVEGKITARIGTYDDYETIGFQAHPVVKTTGQSFEVEFTPQESTPFARFELNLGNEVRKFFIKEVKIYRIEQ